MTITNSSIIKRLLIIFLVFAGLHFAEAFLMPLTIAGVLATLLLPLSRWMEAKKIPKGLAVLISMLVLLAVLAGVGTLLGWQVSELVNDFAILKQKSIETGVRLQDYIFNHLGISLKRQSQMMQEEQPSVGGILQIVGDSLAYIFTNFVLVLAYIFLILYYRSHLKQFIIKLTQPSQKDEMEKVLKSITHVSQQYLLGLAKMIVVLWIMYGIGFSIIGVKNALFFAILCGLLEIIPFVGNITGTTITLLIAFVNGASLTMLLAIIGTYLVIQFIQGWLLEPIIVGPHVKINPFTTVIALVLGKLVWGIPGIFLAIPIIAMAKIVCDNIESLKPYGFLIGEIVTGKGKPEIIKKIKKMIK
ncbi:TPA: AI-2E family transporter [Candidatus Delongbacteria bacterium]|nr:AI-2E family transporter [Candidatus Delongbacteria bacterium]